MKCSQAKSLFSPSLDGAVSGAQMRSLTEHFEACPACNDQYLSLCRTQLLLTSVGRRKARKNLSFRLRLEFSSKAARALRPLFDVFGTRLNNALNAFAVPATAGLIS